MSRLQGYGHGVVQENRDVHSLLSLRVQVDATPTPTPTPLATPTEVPDDIVPSDGPGDAVERNNSGTDNASGMAALISSYDWPVATALRIARCESGDDLHAEPWENWYHRGPFQVSYIHAWRHAARGWDWDTASDEQHIAVAYEIWLEQSWWPWRFSTLCHGVY